MLTKFMSCDGRRWPRMEWRRCGWEILVDDFVILGTEENSIKRG